MFNGCLLPVFSICLLLCLNDPQFMSASPQKSWANIFLFLSVSITLFLSSNVFIQKMFGHLMSGVQTKLCIAGSVAGWRRYLRGENYFYERNIFSSDDDLTLPRHKSRQGSPEILGSQTSGGLSSLRLRGLNYNNQFPHHSHTNPEEHVIQILKVFKVQAILLRLLQLLRNI